MPRAPVGDRLRHMLDAIARIETLTVGKGFEDYAADWVIRDAVPSTRMAESRKLE